MPSQSADPDRPDDLVTRLGLFLGTTYLGVHQRLDRETSGLLVFARRREANASLAAQFDRRVIKKTYLACVSGWPRAASRVTLRDRLVPDRDGTMRVASTRAGVNERGKDAVTQV